MESVSVTVNSQACTNNSEEFFSDSVHQKIEQGKNIQFLSMFHHVNPSQLTDSSGATLLHLAALYGNVWLAKYLIHRGANIDAQNNFKETPLMFAIDNNQVKIVKLLLKADADIYLPDVNGRCALGKSIDNLSLMKTEEFVSANELENASLILHALQNQVTVESLNNSRHVESKVFYDDCPLYEFLTMNNVQIIKILLEKGSPVDAKQPDTGKTSLHIVVERMDFKYVKVLLGYGASAYESLQFIVDFSNQQKTFAMLKILRAAGAKFLDPDRRRIFVDSLLSHGNEQIVRSIWKDFNRSDLYVRQHEHTILHYLAYNKNADILEVLDNFEIYTNFYGSDVSPINERSEALGWTMLHCAASVGNVSSIKFLLDQGAHINARCYNGYTPLGLIFNVNFGCNEPIDSYVECIELLLAHSANPRTITGRHSWFHRRFRPDVNLIEMLKPVIVHLSLIELSHKDIGDNMKTGLCYPDFKKIFNSKKVELEGMMKIQLDKSVTLFEFLAASKENNSMYFRYRKSLPSFFEKIKKYNLDSCYQFILDENYLKFSRLIELRKTAATAIDKALRYVPAYDVAEKIVSYLENQHLHKLLYSLRK